MENQLFEPLGDHALHTLTLRPPRRNSYRFCRISPFYVSNFWSRYYSSMRRSVLRSKLVSTFRRTMGPSCKPSLGLLYKTISLYHGFGWEWYYVVDNVLFRIFSLPKTIIVCTCVLALSVLMPSYSLSSIMCSLWSMLLYS